MLTVSRDRRKGRRSRVGGVVRAELAGRAVRCCSELLDSRGSTRGTPAKPDQGSTRVKRHRWLGIETAGRTHLESVRAKFRRGRARCRRWPPRGGSWCTGEASAAARAGCGSVEQRWHGGAGALRGDGMAERRDRVWWRLRGGDGLQGSRGA